MSENDNIIDLTKVLEINEFIKSIDSKAFFIKLNALNALFLAIRSGEQLRGYIVVTDEFNRFSEELMKFSMLLLEKVHNIVFLVSDQLKQNHRLRLYEKVIQQGNMESMTHVRQFVNAHATKITKINDEVRTSLASITSSLKGNERLVLRGNVLAMQAKIEGAYSKSSREVFMEVAQNFQDHNNQIRNSLQNLIKMLGKKII